MNGLVSVISGNETVPGVPVVFLHGILGTPRMWSTLAPEIATCRPWYSLSLPWHLPRRKRADSCPENLTERDLAKIYESKLVELIGDRPVALVGWSTGAMIALALAAWFPERVAGVCSLAGFATGRWRGPLGRLQKLAVHGSGQRRICHAVLRLMGSHPIIFRRMIGACDEQLQQAEPARLRDALDGWYEDFRRFEYRAIASLMGCIAQMEFNDQLSRIAAPVLLMAGCRDRIIPWARTEQLIGNIPHARIEDVQNAGHLFPFTHCEIVNQWIVKWLGEVERYSWPAKAKVA